MLSKRFRSTLGSGRATTALGVVLVCAAAIGGLFFWTYLQSTRAEVARRDHRILASGVRQLHFRIDGVVEVLSQTLLACHPKPLQGFRRCVEERIPEIPGARLTQPSGRQAQTYDLARGNSTKPHTDLEEEPGMAIFLEGEPAELRLLVALHRHSDKTPHRPLWIQVDLADSIALTSRQKAFESVLLSDGDQILLYRSDASALPIGDLRELLHRAGSDGTAPAMGHAALTEPKPTPVVSAWDWLSGDPRPISAVGDMYDVFVKRTKAGHVIHHAAGGALVADLVLIGVASEASFVDESRVLPPWIATAILLVALLSLFLSPVARLFWIAPQERVTLWSARLIAGGAFVATALVAFMLTDALLYRALRRNNEKIAAALAHSVEAELRRQVCDAGNRVQWAQRALLPAGNNNGTHLVEFEADRLPNPFAVSLVGRSGQIERYWDFSAKSGSRVIQLRPYLRGGNFSDRRYFTDVQTDNLLSICAGRGDPVGPRFSLDVVRSRFSGSPAVVIAVPADGAVPSDPHASREQRRVLTIGGPLLSSMTPVLPPGYSYAVIDRTGGVLFHSDLQRAKVENLLGELDSVGSLAQALRFGTRGSVDSEFSYLGTSVKLYLRPMKGFDDWTVVIAHDTKLTRTIHGLVVLHWVAQLALYLLLLGGSVWLLHRIRPPSRHWMRPRPELAARYLHTVFVIAAIGLFASAAAFTYPSDFPSIGGFFVPVTVLLVLLVRFAWDQRRNRMAKFVLGSVATLLSLGLWIGAWVDEGILGGMGEWLVLFAAALTVVPGGWLCRWWLRRRPALLATSYPLLVTVVLLVLAGVPSACFLAASYTAVTARAQQYGQVEIFRKFVDEARDSLQNPTMAQSVATVTPWNWGEFFPTHHFADRSVSKWFEQCKCRRNTDRCPKGCGTDSPVVATSREWYQSSLEVTTTTVAGLMQWVVGLSPSDALGVQLAVDSAQSKPPGCWRDERCSNGVVGLCLDDGRLQKLIQGQSPDSTFGFAARPLTLKLSARERNLLLLLATLLTIGMYVVARAIVRRLFALDPHTWSRGGAPVAPSIGSPPAGPQTFLLLRPSPSVSALARVSVLDIRQCEQENGPAWASGRIVPKGGVVVLDHFDHRLDVAALNRLRLCLLEALAQDDDTAILILSQTDIAESIPIFCSAETSLRHLGRSRADVPERRRWTRALSQFVVHRLPLAAASNADGLLGPAIAGLLARKAQELWHPSEFQQMAIWSSLTNLEKLALIHLAKGGYANYRAAGVLRSLLDRGLITRDPVVGICADAWRRFILHVAPSEPVREWERELRPRTTDALLVPALLVLAGCMALLFVTQQDFALKAVSAFGGVATIIPIASRLFAASTDRSFAKRETSDTTETA
ncbi:MAG: cache domain-containing protein [Candidatus Binatia bacterium]